MKWFNFFIIMQVTNKVLLVFLHQVILLDTYTFSLSTSFFFKKKKLNEGNIYSISENVKIYLRTFIRDNKFLYFIFFYIFRSHRHFALRIWLHFC